MKIFALMGIWVIVLLLVACDLAGKGATPRPGAPSSDQAPTLSVTPPLRTQPVGQAPTQHATLPPTPTPLRTPAATPEAQQLLPTIVPTFAPYMPTAVPTSSPQTQAPKAPISPTATPRAATTRQPSAAQTITLDELHGKLLFFSDRDNGISQLYVMDADGNNQRLCACSELLESLVKREITSPDGKQFLFVKTIGGHGGFGGDVQVWAHHHTTHYEAMVTGAAPGFPSVDYEPVWSPNAKHVAWVSQTNGFDDLYLHDASTGENLQLTQSQWEWYKHPTFSSDGAQLAFWSNRDTGRKQIWAMDVNGGEMRNVSQNEFNDWDPIWVK